MQSDRPIIELTPVMAKMEKDKNIFDKLDLYCIVNFGGQEYRTHTDRNSGKVPVWLDHFHLEGNSGNEIKIKVFDEIKLLPDSFLGEGEVLYSQLTHKNKTELWVDLTKHSKYVGKILLEAQLEGYSQPAEVPQSYEAVSRSENLQDVLNKGGFQEAPFQEGINYGGLKNIPAPASDSFQSTQPIDYNNTTLSETLQKGGFQETFAQEGTKYGGLNNVGGGSFANYTSDTSKISTTTLPDVSGLTKSASGLSDTLDKHGFCETTNVEGAKLAGTKNISGGDQFFKTDNQFGTKDTLSGVLDSNGFQEAFSQDGSKLAGTQNTSY